MFAARARGEATVPTTIAAERATNPFLRAPTLAGRGGPAGGGFRRLRAAKDAFRGAERGRRAVQQGAGDRSDEGRPARPRDAGDGDRQGAGAQSDARRLALADVTLRRRASVARPPRARRDARRPSVTTKAASAIRPSEPASASGASKLMTCWARRLIANASLEQPLIQQQRPKRGEAEGRAGAVEGGGARHRADEA